MKRLNCKTILTIAAELICLAASAQAAEPAPSDGVRPRLYLNAADLSLFRQNAARPEFSVAYADLESRTKKSVDGWIKKYPATETPRTTEELIALGRRDNPGRDHKTVSAAYALRPSAELGRVLREKLLASIGARRINNYWRNDGIHEGETVMQFLEAWDIASGAGLLTESDQHEIKQEMCRAGHFLEGWTLDNNFSQGYQEYYRNVYCLNFHVFATSVMGMISMLYPDLPESPGWLRAAQSDLPKLLFTEFGLDGGYGEGSLHYWHPTFRALLQFMVASRNLGVRDFFADPAVADAMRRTLAWRMNLTAPDGRSFAVGDSDRDTVGAEYLIQGGKILNEPSFVWTGQSILRNARPGMVPGEPYDLFYYDMAAPATTPAELSANLPYSGYGIFRSGWGPRDNFCLLKYGTTFTGRREDEKNLVISGHAHADALELELHHNGIPVTVDPGRVGRYQDWDTYGGYCKATVAHNTAGLGNPWGYDRLDGLYGEHVKKHGREFLYEISQNNIGRADSELGAFGDVGQLGIISAKLKTYDQVTQQRTVVWFRDSGVAVVNDRMESPVEQPYEWYLNPIGKLLNRTANVLTFGDDLAKLDVVPILPKKPTIQIVGKDDPKVPPYYVALRPAAEQHQVANVGKPYEPQDRWGKFTLLVIGKRAKTTAFLNVLIPYEKDAPFAVSPMGSKGVKLTGSDSTLLVSGGGNDDPSLTVDGGFGLARIDRGNLSSYALQRGHGLALGKEPLLNAGLLSKEWAPFFNGALTAAVSLADKRASFSLPMAPMDKGLLMFSPKIEAGKEPVLPIRVSVSFRVNERPRRIIALRSRTAMPQFDDPAFERKTAVWENDPHKDHYLREELDFEYNDADKMVTVQLDVGIRQLVWE